MGKVNWTEEAFRWLEDIYQYIAAYDTGAAIRTLHGIYDKAQILAEFPEIGYRYQGTERNVRVLLYGHYRIMYLVKDDKNVDILGVFHGALDIERYRF